MSRKTGFSQRQSFLDRDVIAENRAIMAYNRRAEKEERQAAREARQKTLRTSLLKDVEVPEGASYQNALNQLVDAITRRVRFGEAAKTAWETLRTQEPHVPVAVLRARWNYPLTQVARNADEAGIRGVPSSLLVTPVKPDETKLELLQVGLRELDGEKVARTAERFIDDLLKGKNVRKAASDAWRGTTRTLNDDTRHEHGRVWANVSRAIADKWAETHPGQNLPSLEEEKAKREAKARQNYRETLLKAGEKVDSWAVFRYEGEILVNALVEGLSKDDALTKATETLNERAVKVSPAEWEVIKTHWARITRSVLNAAK